MHLEMLNKTDVVPNDKLIGMGANQGVSDCNDCHYISSDCSAPCFC